MLYQIEQTRGGEQLRLLNLKQQGSADPITGLYQ